MGDEGRRRKGGEGTGGRTEHTYMHLERSGGKEGAGDEGRRGEGMGGRTEHTHMHLEQRDEGRRGEGRGEG